MKTHCARGHELTPDNTATDRKGTRRCRTCKRMARENMSEKQRAKIAKKRAEYFKENYTTGKMIGIRHAADIIASRPSDGLIAEAQRRAEAPHRDLTGAFFNDPPVGFSMLDRRQSA